MVAVSGDFENEVRRRLIAPGVMIEDLGIDRNLGALHGRLGVSERHLRIQEMATDVIDTGGSRSVGQHNDACTRFWIESDDRLEASGASVVPGDLFAFNGVKKPP